MQEYVEEGKYTQHSPYQNQLIDSCQYPKWRDRQSDDQQAEPPCASYIRNVLDRVCTDVSSKNIENQNAERDQTQDKNDRFGTSDTSGPDF